MFSREMSKGKTVSFECENGQILSGSIVPTVSEEDKKKYDLIPKSLRKKMDEYIQKQKHHVFSKPTKYKKEKEFRMTFERYHFFHTGLFYDLKVDDEFRKKMTDLGVVFEEADFKVRFTKKIKFLSVLSLGFMVKERIKEYRGEGIKIIQMKDLNETSLIIKEGQQFDSIEDSKAFYKFDLKKGDIIIRSRDDKIKAFLFDIESSQRTILSTPLLRLRCYNKNEIDSYYLLWYLNSPKTVSFLRSKMRGTNVKILNKSDLMELEVPLPSLDRQKKIGKLYRLFLRKKAIKEQIKEKEEKLFQAQLFSHINERDSQ